MACLRKLARSTAVLATLVSFSGHADPQATCDASGSPSAGCAAADTATAVRDLGLEVIGQALGQRPVAWTQRQIAPILASVGEGNYGEVAQLRVQFGSLTNEHRFPARTVVVKRVIPKDEGLVGTDARNRTQHLRWLRSFLVEAAAYEAVVPSLLSAKLAAPKSLHITQPSLGKPFTMLIEDISEQYPRGANGEVREMRPLEVQAALRWLAGFHALFWEDPRTEDRGLWARGAYWILDDLARLELEELPAEYENEGISAGDWQRLFRAASAVDARLAGRPASRPRAELTDPRFRTLVHGDAKPENLLCSVAAEVECAGLDFAWTGEGYGMYDVVYLLWDSADAVEVDGLLEHYHTLLLSRLPAGAGLLYKPGVMRRYFELCVVDFMRWMLAFRGGEYFWAKPWALEILRQVLDRLDGGRLLTEEAYAEAVDREFPLP